MIKKITEREIIKELNNMTEKQIEDVIEFYQDYLKARKGGIFK